MHFINCNTGQTLDKYITSTANNLKKKDKDVLQKHLWWGKNNNIVFSF